MTSLWWNIIMGNPYSITCKSDWKISQSLKGTSLVFRFFQSPWNCSSAVLLPSHLPDFKGIWTFWYPILLVQYLTSMDNKMFHETFALSQKWNLPCTYYFCLFYKPRVFFIILLFETCPTKRHRTWAWNKLSYSTKTCNTFTPNYRHLQIIYRLLSAEVHLTKCSWQIWQMFPWW